MIFTEVLTVTRAMSAEREKSGDSSRGAHRVREGSRALQVSEGVVAADLDGEAVLLNVETGVYFGLDPVGTQVWQLLATGLDEEAIIERLLSEYDVAADTLTRDVAGFLSQLEAKGLVTNGEV
jgi:hypothetical protein